MFNAMFPELHVSDCEAAAQFFEKALGYQRAYTLMEDGHLDFAVMRHPDPGLQLLLHRMMPPTESAKPRFMRVYYELKDIDNSWTRLRRDGFSVTDPEPTSYGATIARLDGPDSYAIYFQQWNSRAAAG
jgi:predicted enzyme related to lactoylglutathione lyase